MFMVESFVLKISSNVLKTTLYFISFQKEQSIFRLTKITIFFFYN